MDRIDDNVREHLQTTLAAGEFDFTSLVSSDHFRGTIGAAMMETGLPVTIFDAAQLASMAVGESLSMKSVPVLVTRHA